MKVDNKHNLCLNCKYFVPHYVRQGIIFVKTDCGNCRYNLILKRNSGNKLPEDCRHFSATPAEDNPEAEKEYIKSHLKKIDLRLQGILTLLEIEQGRNNY